MGTKFGPRINMAQQLQIFFKKSVCIFGFNKYESLWDAAIEIKIVKHENSLIFFQLWPTSPIPASEMEIQDLMEVNSDAGAKVRRNQELQSWVRVSGWRLGIVRNDLRSCNFFFKNRSPDLFFIKSLNLLLYSLTSL